MATEHYEQLIQRKTRPEPQQSLFEAGSAWDSEWWGMPEFVMSDARPLYKITVNLYTLDDLRELGKALGLRVTPQTDSLTYPAPEAFKPSEWEYGDA